MHPTKLSPLQISLLRLFEHGISEQQTLEVRRMLVAYFSEQLQQEVERVNQERNYSAADIDQMLNDPS